MEQDNLPLFPVSTWEIGTIPAYDALFIRFAFLTNLMQPLEEAEPGRRYVLLAAQARELRDAIDRALVKLEGAGPQPPPGPAH